MEAIQTASVGQKGSDESGLREALVKALDQLTEAVKSQQGKGEIQVTATLPEEIARLVAEKAKIAEEKKDTRREQSPVPRAQRQQDKQKSSKRRKSSKEREIQSGDIPHPYINLRDRIVRVAADAEGEQNEQNEQNGQGAPEQANTPQPIPPPQDQNGGNPNPAPGFPLRWPSGDREWAASTLAGRTGYRLNMTVIEVYQAMGNEFFKLQVPRDTEGNPYRGPREWSVEYDQGQNQYLKELLEQLYPGGITEKPRQEDILSVWPDCPVTEGFICPFCLAARRNDIQGMSGFNNLHNHIICKAETEAKKLPINSADRIHDPAIFTQWYVYFNRTPNTNRNGSKEKCRWCGLIKYYDTADHTQKRFYCRTRQKGWDLAQAIARARMDVMVRDSQRATPPAQPPVPTLIRDAGERVTSTTPDVAPTNEEYQNPVEEAHP